ncbi:MAG: Inactive metal-dependent protease-like protein [Candidatus Collierbacteria bacterium GW2011_GWC2_45_15]|uniref:Inactive metal-dependent protease-like protein n=2 Tax=Candidatus Collieribacteriota TaxID=1752725 RepID=A0A0G1S6C1_9BACT|nr:MAG: Inactive metal-dependent protease-like protein [Candidatus Collierbacteria bacterium GW2011_GWC2_45_15]KKU28770.1 MAG: Inactive metal-dependent protease-like protein [Candidatus Collierbacteria bacterium GW2011_GWE1_46_18]
MRIYIDSTDNTKAVIRIDDKEYTRNVESPRDQDVLGFLVHCLEERNIKPEDIDEIEVNPGPGSFTGTRVGVAIANVLGFALDIKVNGSMTPVEPIYSSPPSITKKKDT